LAAMAVDELLHEAFRHNAWASKRLIAFCRDLPPERLAATTQGVYGSILETLNHLIAAEAGYLPRVKVNRPAWAGDDSDLRGLDELAARVDEIARLWEVYLSDPLDARQPLLLDEGAYQAQSSIPIVQALHHGNVHREQVCAILTSLGIVPPDLQAWAWGEATGRARELHPQKA
jgi:uncharacterized damage-inducible protein DinB